MASGRPQKAAKIVDPPSSEEEAQTQPSQLDASQQPQEVDVDTLTQLVNKTTQQHAQRKKQRMREIERTRQQRLDRVQQKIDGCKREHEATLKSLRLPHAKRLHQLLQQKIDTDHQLHECYTLIERGLRSTRDQMQVAVEHSIAHLSD